MKKIMTLCLATAMLATSVSTCFSVRAETVDESVDIVTEKTQTPTDPDDDLPDDFYDKYDDLVCYETGDYRYSILVEDGSARIEAYLGEDKEIVIPSELDGKTVTAIGLEAFAWETKITSVTIPSSVKTIDCDAFYACFDLTTVNLSEGLTTIDCNAFSSCDKLENIILPDTLTTIENCAFSSCDSLKSINIPAKVTTLDYYAFHLSDSLEKIDVDSNNEYFSSIDGVVFNKEQTALLIYPNGKTGDYIVPDGVTEIGKSAFAYSLSLTGITIPDSVTSINTRAFQSCTSLKSVTLPKGITTITEYLFYNCKSLESVEIPNGVTTIGIRAFDSCEKLSNIIIPETVTDIGVEAFGETPFIARFKGDFLVVGDGILCRVKTSLEGEVTLPDGIKAIYDSAFEHCGLITSVTIPDGVTQIPDNAFLDCFNMETISIPNTVTSIGNRAFENCKKLNNVVLPDGVTSIGNFAFRSCAKLQNLTIPESVTFIGYEAFEKAPFFFRYEDEFMILGDQILYRYFGEDWSIVIPDGVKTINEGAFADTKQITAVTIPDSVTVIQNRAFSFLYNLTDIHYTSTENKWNSIDIGKENESLFKATIHFESVGTPDGPIKPIGTYGDLTGDRLISATDALYVQRYAVGYGTFNDMEKVAADVNDDGRINSQDVLEILRCSTGYTSDTNVGKDIYPKALENK